MKLVGLQDDDKYRYCGKTEADSIYILYCIDQIVLETKYELIDEMYIQINRIERDPAALNIFYIVIENKLPNDVPSNLSSVTSDLL